MPGGKSRNKARSVPATPEQHQEVDFDEEGEETDTEDQQNEKASAVSLQQEVKSTAASTVPPGADDVAAGTDA